MGILQEFKEFASKGNVVDLAVGVIIGGAFGKIVDSLVADVIMPPIGMVLGKVDFKNLYIPLAGQSGPLEEAKKAGPVIGYGAFLNTFIQFLIVAFAIFMLVKAMNKLRAAPAPAPAPAAPPEPSAEEKLLTEIRDLLASK